jgi:hypothetical protein
VKFNDHYNLVGKHALLSPSQYSWIRYDDLQMAKRYQTQQAARLGTRLHELAHELIGLGIKLPAGKKTLNAFVNDAIRYRMTSEQILVYSDNCYGTADALSFRQNLLRISDLKTGETHASFDQVLVYDALFCLEYNFSPFDIAHDLRIYQSDDMAVYFGREGDPESIPVEVAEIMAQIKHLDALIEVWKKDELE